MNNFTSIVNLTSDVETLELGGRECRKLRVADNTFGKNNLARFFDVIVSSAPDISTADRLAKGDQIVVTGTLTLSEYTAKKTTKFAKKGQKVRTDSMPFGRILQVTRSETFFAKDDSFEPDELEGNGETEGSTDAPDLTGDGEGTDEPLV